MTAMRVQIGGVWYEAEGDVRVASETRAVPLSPDNRDALVRAAWEDYLDSTTGYYGVDYEQIEPWAWARLQGILREIRDRSRT